MNQIISPCGVSIKGKFMIAHLDRNSDMFMDRTQCAARLMVMLRSFYAFPNALSVTTKTTPDDCISVSLLSERFARVVEIHNDCGYKMSLMTMGV